MADQTNEKKDRSRNEDYKQPHNTTINGVQLPTGNPDEEPAQPVETPEEHAQSRGQA